MGRKQPPPPTKPVPRSTNDIITQIREYELITPLFGGGAVPGEADEDQPIRGSEIRGQLRFWWRACRGGIADGDSAKLKDEEDKIWGAAAKPDKKGNEEKQSTKLPTVQLTVEFPPNAKGKLIPAHKVRYNNNHKLVADPTNGIPGYASFSLQPEQKELQAARTPQDVALKHVRTGIKFILNITYSKEHKKDVEAAFWAWETFGGLGARTRRGFGALRCTGIVENKQSGTHTEESKKPDLMPQNEKQVEWLQSRLQQYVVEGKWPIDVPHLSRDMADGWNFLILNKGSREPTYIWNYLISGLKGFRQNRPNLWATVPGKSLWPEADIIRHLTGKRHKAINRRNATGGPSHPTTSKFPRAQLGLPLIFHFPQAGDPADTTVIMHDSDTDKDIERLASPLILKPLAYEGGYAGLVVILKGSGVIEEWLRIKTTNINKKSINTYLDKKDKPLIMREQGEKGTDRYSPKIRVDQQIDTLEAFMNYMYERN